MEALSPTVVCFKAALNGAGGADLMTGTCAKIRYGGFNAHISRSLKIVCVGEELKKYPLPNDRLEFKVSTK